MPDRLRLLAGHVLGLAVGTLILVIIGRLTWPGLAVGAALAVIVIAATEWRIRRRASNA